MKIVVLVKHVPVRGAVRVDSTTGRPDQENVEFPISSLDVRALIRAAELRDTLGGEVVVLISYPLRPMGPVIRAAPHTGF